MVIGTLGEPADPSTSTRHEGWGASCDTALEVPIADGRRIDRYRSGSVGRHDEMKTTGSIEGAQKTDEAGVAGRACQVLVDLQSRPSAFSDGAEMIAVFGL